MRPKPGVDVENAEAPAETLDEAIKDQLGVKLTPVKALLVIPIVDQVSAPKEN